MKNKKTTKRALLSSVLSLLVCMAMLLGTTYAWFTDSAVSAGNKITAGTLDVELYKWTSATAATPISTSKAPVLDANILWEPGYTEVVYLSIKNEGNLALKYQVAIDVTSVSEDNLADVMEYTVTPDAKFGEVASWAGNGTKIENAPGMNATNYKDVVLAPGAEHFFALSVHMLETATNEYMGESITFDIRVIAGQAVAEEDAFNNQYDVLAEYPETMTMNEAFVEGTSAVDFEFRNEDDTKVASITVPAGALADNVSAISATVAKSDYTNANIVVADGFTAAAFDVSVGGLAENNQEPVTVSLRIPAGLDPSTVTVYHYGTPVPGSNYNPSTGYVTFQTTEFSPFTVVYDAESEYEAPEADVNNAPKAEVTYASEYVNTELPWGSFGQWSPTAGLDSNLEAAFVFACPEKDDGAFDNWYCDFYVSLDRALGDKQIFLGGNYGSFGWVGFHNDGVTLKANEEIGLLESVTTNPWTYADVKNFVGTFTCGVGDVDDALKGATFTVKLRLTNPENSDDFIDVNVVTYTFGGEGVNDKVVIDGNTIATSAQDVYDAFENGDENITLGGDINLDDLNNLFGGN